MEENKDYINTNNTNPDEQPTTPAPEETADSAVDNAAETSANTDNTTDSRHSRRRDRRHRHDNDDKETAEKLQQLGEKLAELNDKYMRTVAEYENHRRRTQKEKAELILNGGKDVIKAILPIVDDMERALASIPEDNTAREGVQLIYNKLMNTLRSKGLKPMEAKGERFDENLHEAVTQLPAPDESQKGTVMDVVEKGYYLNDSVLRYAKVVVAV
ncbi:MAG: nucleotide exchange factor GrpE [Bacteroidales bacterium]|nr:nucleotide exchange factor GrpE [Bacteroidales bacterium]